MIPAFDAGGNLPPGIHPATWTEIVDRYDTNSRRRALLDGLLAALRSLRDAGCRVAYIDGSFVTTKDLPRDFDACWEVAGVDADLLDPVLLDFRAGRAAQKLRFRGELFPADARAARDGASFLAYFQTNRKSGAPKGIVAIDLSDLP